MSITLTSLLFLCSAAFSHEGTGSAAGYEPPDISPVVLINSAGSTCAGSLVDDLGTVVTAYHCIERRRPITVTTYGGDVHDAELWRADRANDLALLRVDSLSGQPHLTINTQTRVGESVTVIGHPFGSLADRVAVLDDLLRWSVTGGTVAAVGQSLIQLDSAFNPGTSGGGVLNRDGQLIGVASRKLRGEGLAFAVPSEKVSDLLIVGDVSLFTGALTLEGAFLMPLDTSTPSLLIGPALEINDRLVMEARLGLPVAAKWRTLAFGQTSWRTWEAQVFYRLRRSSASNSVTVELGGGFAGVASQSGVLSDDGRFQPLTTNELPITSASIRLGVGGWKLGVINGSDGGWGLSVERTMVGRLMRF